MAWWWKCQSRVSFVTVASRVHLRSLVKKRKISCCFNPWAFRESKVSISHWNHVASVLPRESCPLVRAGRSHHQSGPLFRPKSALFVYLCACTLTSQVPGRLQGTIHTGIHEWTHAYLHSGDPRWLFRRICVCAREKPNIVLVGC